MNDIIKYLMISALRFWGKCSDYIWGMLTSSLEGWKDGILWDIAVNVNDGIRYIAYGLLVIFFGCSLIRESVSFSDMKRPENILRLFLRYIIAKAVITYGMTLMGTIYKIAGGIVSKIRSVGFNNPYTVRGGGVPEWVQEAISNLTWYESLVGIIFAVITFVVVVVLSITVMLTVYSRFFKLYIYVALAPIPLSTIAGEGTQMSGWQFIKSFTAICLEAAVIGLACIIFSKISQITSISNWFDSGRFFTTVLGYMVELIFHMLLMVGIVKGASGIVKEMAAL